MNYENFSPEAQKVIDDFRNLIENIKSRKDKSTVWYSWYKGFYNLYIMSPAITKFREAIYCYCFTARLLKEDCFDVQNFLQEKNYFLPKFSSYEDYQQNKHKYPYIKE